MEQPEQHFTVPPERRHGWGVGPWVTEPDIVRWADPDTGLACLVARNGDTGVLCGYVGVPADHPLHGASFDPRIAGLRAHRGITYTSQRSGDRDHWWIGFHCGFEASGDLTPGPRASHAAVDGQYRTVDYVQAECAKLAQQLHRLRGRR